MRPLLMLFQRDIHKLEYDPQTQYRFHLSATWFWMFCILSTPFVAAFRDNLLGMLIMEVSLWANAATHFGAMSSALAAKQTAQSSTDTLQKSSEIEQLPPFDA